MKELLIDFDKQEVSNFCIYIKRLKTDVKNDWAKGYTDEAFVEMFKKVHAQGLVFDGVHITLQQTGISFDYVAYKNKMLLVYPESIIDLQLVFDKDEISFSKDSGKIIYSHKINAPFIDSKDKKIVGGYCVIKNKRGEFLTTLNSDELEKHRKVAKQDYIWSQWFAEMAMKTIIKKAVKYHFNDIFTDIEEEDNTQYDLENPLDIDLKWKQEIEAINDDETLRKYWKANEGRGKGFLSLVLTRRKEILANKK